MDREWVTSDDGKPVVEIGCAGCSLVATLTGADLIALVCELHEKTGAAKAVRDCDWEAQYESPQDAVDSALETLGHAALLSPTGMGTETLLVELTLDAATNREWVLHRVRGAYGVREAREVPVQPREEVLAEAVEIVTCYALTNELSGSPEEARSQHDVAARLRAMGEGPTAADYEAVMEGSLLKWGIEPAPIEDVVKDIRQRAAELAREREGNS